MLKIARRHGPREGFVGAASEALFLWCYVMRGFLGAEIHSRRQQLQLDSAGGGFDARLRHVGPFRSGRWSPCSDCHASEDPDHGGGLFPPQGKGT